MKANSKILNSHVVGLLHFLQGYSDDWSAGMPQSIIEGFLSDSVQTQRDRLGFWLVAVIAAKRNQKTGVGEASTKLLQRRLKTQVLKLAGMQSMRQDVNVGAESAQVISDGTETVQQIGRSRLEMAYQKSNFRRNEREPLSYIVVELPRKPISFIVLELDQTGSQRLGG